MFALLTAAHRGPPSRSWRTTTLAQAAVPDRIVMQVEASAPDESARDVILSRRRFSLLGEAPPLVHFLAHYHDASSASSDVNPLPRQNGTSVEGLAGRHTSPPGSRPRGTSHTPRAPPRGADRRSPDETNERQPPHMVPHPRCRPSFSASASARKPSAVSWSHCALARPSRAFSSSFLVLSPSNTLVQTSKDSFRRSPSRATRIPSRSGGTSRHHLDQGSAGGTRSRAPPRTSARSGRAKDACARLPAEQTPTSIGSTPSHHRPILGTTKS